ncbi:BLOC-1-related complex subunit 5 [Planococcus citri]|uniref:BLOC-1-related complex subunit 5 n=1 Tax=Planococcus citri TaxID=170843 RepID=UPI0031FA3687
MGSEQSSQQGKAVRAGLRRGKSVPEYRADEPLPDEDENEETGNISPEPSVCSDSDLPYISYTVNRPIGDSPKKKPPARRLSRGKSLASATSSRKAKKKPQVPMSSSGHNIVVVKEAAAQPTKSNDPELITLQRIPQFLPIMRATLSAPAARDPEVLERLDSTPLCNLCHLYQNALNKCATEVSSEQDKLTKQIIRVDKKSSQIMSTFTERQKAYAKYADKFGKINDVVKQVEKCNATLKETIKKIQQANDALPDDLKLEPFAWTTG